MIKRGKNSVEFEFQRFEVEKLLVGVASDAQLPPFPFRKKPGVFERNLTKVFRCFARRGVTFVIFAGDICNLGSGHAYRAFLNALNKAYDGKPPVFQCVMGNHDYRLGLAPAESMRRLFRKRLGQSPFTHYEVNGYRFLGISPVNAKKKDAYRSLAPRLTAEIERALAASPDKPVFVTTHNSAANTVYASETEGDRGLYEILAPYERVVNLAGHSHASVFDALSIHQKDYTSLTSQSTAYVELEAGKIDGPLPPNAIDCPSALILTFGDSEIAIEPVAAAHPTEPVAACLKSLPLPFSKERFLYANPTTPAPPSMPDRVGAFYLKKRTAYLRFRRGRSEANVRSYLLKWSDGTEQAYFSDFYLGAPGSEYFELKIYLKTRGVYDVLIYAVDAFGQFSKDFTKIPDVRVLRKKRLARLFAHGKASIWKHL